MSNQLREVIRPKISFGCLKAEASGLNHSQYSNKENDLSFQNIKNDQNPLISYKNSIKRKLSQKESFDANFSTKIKSIAKSPSQSRRTSDYFQIDDLEGDRNYEQNCMKNKISFESQIQKSYQGSVKSKAQELFLENQKIIREFIDDYNNKFNEIIETLTDMQIKDLMKFNSMIEKNEKIYENWANPYKIPNFITITGHQSSKIYELSLYIDKLCESPTVSTDFRSTVDSKTIRQKKQERNSEKVSPQLTQQMQSMGSKKIKNSLEDTPQSVKSKLSEVSNKIKAAQNKKIGMFDRINICESIEEGLMPMSISFKSEEQKQKKQHRYGRVSEE